MANQPPTADAAPSITCGAAQGSPDEQRLPELPWRAASGPRDGAVALTHANVVRGRSRVAAEGGVNG